MKKVKKNNRTKALFGIDDAIIIPALIAAAGSLAGAGISAYNTRQTAEDNLRRQTLNQNLQNSMMQQTNEQQARNYNSINELALSKTNNINTLNSAMCFGGKRRMKKAGGTISANVKGLSRYI